LRKARAEWRGDDVGEIGWERVRRRGWEAGKSGARVWWRSE